MAKEKFNFRAAYERVDEIKSRLAEIAQGLEDDKEREALTPAEEGEVKQLNREYSILEMKIKANTPSFNLSQMRESRDEINRQMRECVKENKRFEIKVSRAVDSGFNGNASGYADPAATANPAGLTIGDIVKPLYGKTILSAIGVPLLTGLKGNYMWPVVEAFSATVLDEGAALGDTKIPVNKLFAKPERIGVAVPITREALNETDDLLRTVCTEYMPTAVAALMNKIMFGTKKVTNATNLVGPYVNCKAANKKEYEGDAPTLKQLLELKALVLAANIMPENMCYVMTETTKALLEATPKWDGANVAIVDDNGRINGVPVFTTSYAEEGVIEFGAFKYAPQGMFGDMTFIVDPYTQARKNAIDFVLNADYAVSVLRQEAFAMLTKSAGVGG